MFESVDCHTLFLPATKKSLLQDLSQVSGCGSLLGYRLHPYPGERGGPHGRIQRGERQFTQTD